jgi:hypothetical protein
MTPQTRLPLSGPGGTLGKAAVLRAMQKYAHRMDCHGQTGYLVKRGQN